MSVGRDDRGEARAVLAPFDAIVDVLTGSGNR